MTRRARSVLGIVLLSLGLSGVSMGVMMVALDAFTRAWIGSFGWLSWVTLAGGVALSAGGLATLMKARKTP